VVRLPRISNATDVEALACEPGVAVRFVTEPSRLTDADLVVLPGTKSTVDDLAWLRRQGLADAVAEHVRSGRPLLAICGGFQMLANRIDDAVESGALGVPGLRLLDMDIEFAAEKTLGRPVGVALGEPVTGYEIHHGRVTRRGSLAPLIEQDEGALDGSIAATHWHGLLDNDAFRRELLRWAAAHADRPGFTPAPDTRVADIRAAQLDLLGDLVADHLDTAAVTRLIEEGAPPNLPTVHAALH
jgi:adenosylcobyric acid synthase